MRTRLSAGVILAALLLLLAGNLLDFDIGLAHRVAHGFRLMLDVLADGG